MFNMIRTTVTLFVLLDYHRTILLFKSKSLESSHKLLDDEEVTPTYTWFETVARNSTMYSRGESELSALSETQANTIPLYTPILVNLGCPI